MSQLNPQRIVDEGVIQLSKESSVQQVGIDLTLSKGVSIGHGESTNVDFQEKIFLPEDIFSTFTQRSSYSRRGIFMTTGVYDPGYNGSIGCTIYNMSGEPIQIGAKERVGQMLFFKADAASEYDGQWQNT